MRPFEDPVAASTPFNHPRITCFVASVRSRLSNETSYGFFAPASAHWSLLR